MRDASCSSASRQMIWGLILAGLGTLFLLDNLGYVDAGSVFRFWPLILIAIGASKMLRSRDAGAR